MMAGWHDRVGDFARGSASRFTNARCALPSVADRSVASGSGIFLTIAPVHLVRRSLESVSSDLRDGVAQGNRVQIPTQRPSQPRLNLAWRSVCRQAPLAGWALADAQPALWPTRRASLR